MGSPNVMLISVLGCRSELRHSGRPGIAVQFTARSFVLGFGAILRVLSRIAATGATQPTKAYLRFVPSVAGGLLAGAAPSTRRRGPPASSRSRPRRGRRKADRRSR